ncbi:MAG: branched-chain amino acid ABC transporter permease [Deltaproteobacteria bacterium]|nr:branched-chain amino acid ABC transporter permease [Deltaproteobacteria bacterium]
MRLKINLIAILVVSFILPLLIRNQYQQHLLVMSGIFVLFSVGLNVIVGFLGQLSLGHSAYFGIGAYTYALLLLNWGVPFYIGMILAIVVSGVFGFLIGYPSLRLRGPYFAIVSLAFAMIIRLIVINWESLTNGPMGLTGIKPPVVSLFKGLQVSFNTSISNYYVTLFFIIVGIFVIHRIKKSRVGEAFDACRENEELAQAVGINTFKVKIIAFIISTMFIGASGSLYARYLTYISPEIFGWYYIATPLIMVIIGGTGTIVGPILGAVIFTFLPEYLRAIAGYRLAIFGLVIIIGIIFMPNGLYGIWQKFSRSENE